MEKKYNKLNENIRIAVLRVCCILRLVYGCTCEPLYLYCYVATLIHCTMYCAYCGIVVSSYGRIVIFVILVILAVLSMHRCLNVKRKSTFKNAI